MTSQLPRSSNNSKLKINKRSRGLQEVYDVKIEYISRAQMDSLVQSPDTPQSDVNNQQSIISTSLNDPYQERIVRSTRQDRIMTSSNIDQQATSRAVKNAHVLDSSRYRYPASQFSIDNDVINTTTGSTTVNLTTGANWPKKSSSKLEYRTSDLLRSLERIVHKDDLDHPQNQALFDTPAPENTCQRSTTTSGKYETYINEPECVRPAVKILPSLRKTFTELNLSTESPPESDQSTKSQRDLNKKPSKNHQTFKKYFTGFFHRKHHHKHAFLMSESDNFKLQKKQHVHDDDNDYIFDKSKLLKRAATIDAIDSAKNPRNRFDRQPQVIDAYELRSSPEPKSEELVTSSAKHRKKSLPPCSCPKLYRQLIVEPDKHVDSHRLARQLSSGFVDVVQKVVQGNAFLGGTSKNDRPLTSTSTLNIHDESVVENLRRMTRANYAKLVTMLNRQLLSMEPLSYEQMWKSRLLSLSQQDELNWRNFSILSSEPLLVQQASVFYIGKLDGVRENVVQVRIMCFMIHILIVQF